MARSLAMDYIFPGPEPVMSRNAARLIAWSGSLAIAAGAMLTVALNLAYGDELFAARLIAGLTGCL
jgi:hypothetical protein